MMKLIHTAPRGDDNTKSGRVLTIEIGGELKIIQGRDAWAFLN